VRGIKLQSDQRLISLIVVKEGGTILTATENGFGKRTNVDEFPIVARGGQGVKAIQINSRNGKVIGALQAYDQDELMLITDQGTLTRIRVNEISVISRNTKGVKLINLSPEENLVEIERILDEDANDNDAGSNGNDQNLEDNSNNVS
jgi:DNA gyrase subunit A